MWLLAESQTQKVSEINPFSKLRRIPLLRLYSLLGPVWINVKTKRIEHENLSQFPLSPQRYEKDILKKHEETCREGEIRLLRMSKNVDSFKSSPIFRFINFLNPYSRVSVEFGDKDPNTYFSGEC